MPSPDVLHAVPHDVDTCPRCVQLRAEGNTAALDRIAAATPMPHDTLTPGVRPEQHPTTDDLRPHVQVARVRALHHPILNGGDREFCADDSQWYPCATIRELDR